MSTTQFIKQVGGTSVVNRMDVLLDECNAKTSEIETSLLVGSTGTVSTKAVLECVSTTKGLLLPRMTTAQRDAIASPPSGLLIYNTTTNKLNFYAAAAWEVVTSV